MYLLCTIIIAASPDMMVYGAMNLLSMSAKWRSRSQARHATKTTFSGKIVITYRLLIECTMQAVQKAKQAARNAAERLTSPMPASSGASAQYASADATKAGSSAPSGSTLASGSGASAMASSGTPMGSSSASTPSAGSGGGSGVGSAADTYATAAGTGGAGGAGVGIGGSGGGSGDGSSGGGGGGKGASKDFSSDAEGKFPWLPFIVMALAAAVALVKHGEEVERDCKTTLKQAQSQGLSESVARNLSLGWVGLQDVVTGAPRRIRAAPERLSLAGRQVSAFVTGKPMPPSESDYKSAQKRALEKKQAEAAAAAKRAKEEVQRKAQEKSALLKSGMDNTEKMALGFARSLPGGNKVDDRKTAGKVCMVSRLRCFAG